jgi:hypothetical protein
MSKDKPSENAVVKSIASFFLNKPIWVWWIAYAAITGVLFGVFYAAISLMMIQWWIPVLVILATGIIWGSIAFAHRKPETKENDKTSS